MARKKRATQPRLPEMADSKLDELHNTALHVAEISDTRRQLALEEKEVKGELLGLMHHYHKTKYKFEGVEVEIRPEEIKVRVKKQKAKIQAVEPNDSFDPGEVETAETA